MQVPGSGGLLFLLIGAVAITVILFRPKDGINFRASGGNEGEKPTARYEVIEGWLQAFANAIHGKNGSQRRYVRAVPPPPQDETEFAAPFVRPDFNAQGADLYSPIIREVAKEVGVDPSLAQAIAEIASGYDSNFVSPAGRIGLMQLPEGLLREYGASDPIAPRQNIRAALNYLAILIQNSGGRFEEVIAAYHNGSKELAASGMSPETRSFVEAVTGVYGILKANEANAGQVSSNSAQ